MKDLFENIRYNLICRLAGIKEIFQYPLFEKQNQHITESAKKLIKRYLDIETIDNPEIQIDNDLVQKSAVNFNINNDELNVLLGVGGSGPTKRIPSSTFLRVMEKLEALKKLKKSGLKVKIIGTGIVKYQSLKAGTQIQNQDKIILELS